ncbi:MAG: helix-turn-helix domain-containing protein [Oscillospiraceae bacterium]|nr:helix-turn-helix domain-containing protein [Oscillospiraceae bacterium]
MELLAERIGITPATVSFHLKKPEEVGAVQSRKEQYYTVYSINREVFDVSIPDILSERLPAAHKPFFP